jgi:hypothetical protein
MAANDKDTIYVDIDDEITGIIDKLKGSNGKVVALVLPKRATVFQSIVNMKLLKRAADSSKKNAVLITSEAGLLPLAGIAGVHVAKTLTSKPEIPLAPTAFDDTVEAIGEDGQELEALPDPKQTVGELADRSTSKLPADGVETLMLDAEDIPPEAEDGLKPAGSKTFEPSKDAKKNKNKKLKVPNFEKFRLLLILGALLLLLLIGGFIFANATLPKAVISIKTNATKVATNLNLNLSTTATTLDASNNTLPAKLAQQQKTYTANSVTTGQKNNGNKASGSITITNCGPSNETIPAGTGFSASGNTFISQSDVTIPQSDFKFDHTCKNNGTASVNVIAQTGGSSYNLPGNTTYTIASGPSYTTAQGGTMSGGTDNIVQSVNQNDINNAKAKINTNDPTVEQSLINQLQQSGYYAISATYSPGTPTVTPSASVGTVTNSVTVTETVTYTIFGVHKSDLQSVVDTNINSQIDSSKQSILDDGISTATITVNNISSTSAQLAMSGKAIAGPQLDIATIKKQAEGKKTGDVQSQLQNNPNVTGVTVKLSPFWVSSVPNNTSRITVNVAKPTTTTKASTNANNP